jgi:hypothetical protein
MLEMWGQKKPGGEMVEMWRWCEGKEQCDKAVELEMTCGSF